MDSFRDYGYFIFETILYTGVRMLKLAALRSSLLLVITSLMSFTAHAGSVPKTVDYVDVGQYLGTWYQIARNPLFFEDGCVCSIQKLNLRSDGLVGVFNTCNVQTPSGALRSISGTAKNEDPQSNSKFTVDFGLPHTGEYWIIGLDSQYRYAVVSDPSGKSLYILSKTPTLPTDLYQSAVAAAAEQVDTSMLQQTLQNGCTYP